MITLVNVTIEKYKCFTSSQSFEIDPDITVLVGVNESGKTAALEAIAKSNYFNNDPDFAFNKMLDYPRMEKKRYDKTGIPGKAIICEYKLNSSLIEEINAEFGYSILLDETVKCAKKYDNTSEIEINISPISEKYKDSHFFDSDVLKKINDSKGSSDISLIIEEIGENEEAKNELELIKKYYCDPSTDDPIKAYIINYYIKPNLPKFIYYDEYYALPSRINLLEIKNNQISNESMKTAKALIELADMDINEVIRTDDFENLQSELEATANDITQELFKYWSTNQNLRVDFKIDKKKGQNGDLIPYLDIRIYNELYHLTLPLKNRSKGFIWFFSFIVWFNKIQEDPDTKYILLLDEPGLNLHATAQNDLLKFFENLSQNYQIIYSTHSPFMIDSLKLNQIRTVVESDNGAKISTSIQEKDSSTLFPLQAALGYDIAQNLFIGPNNLLVEGPADIIYIEVLSGLLESQGRIGLDQKITLVPCGGLDKVATFISLLRGNQLNMVCLLDSYIDSGSKQRIEDLIKYKIIKDCNIRYFDEFTTINGNKAEIEDMFSKIEYLTLFLQAFPKQEKITVEQLNSQIGRILKQIEAFYNIERFNHYSPANELLKMTNKENFISDETLDRFENMFNTINKLFD